MQLTDNSTYKDTYNTTCNWPEGCFTQCGSKGVVGTKNGCYETAYFEAFPNDMFIRGEGNSIEEAEKNAYEKYIKYTTCSNHEFEKVESYQNGMGKCKHCGFMKVVFEPDYTCVVCNKHENYTRILSKYKKSKDSCICEECASKPENFYLMSGMTIKDLARYYGSFSLFGPIVEDKTLQALKTMPDTIEDFYAILEKDSNPFILERAKRMISEADEDDIMFKSLNIKVSSYEELYQAFYDYHLKRFLEAENEKH